MRLTIDTLPELDPILEKQAQGNNKTNEEMAAHYLNKMLARQYKDEVKHKIEVEPIENVKIYDTVIEAERVKIYPVVEAPEKIDSDGSEVIDPLIN